jgi:RNA polymerase sigma-54 factor
MVLRSQILELTQIELQQAIETELNENPALECLDDDSEPITEEAVLRVVAPQELRPGSEDFEFRRSVSQDEGSPDWVELAAAPANLSDHLHAQLCATLPEEMHVLARYLIDCLDDRGYFESSVEEVALETGQSLEDVEAALLALKKCEPRGVGATSLQECLLLQLESADSVDAKLARVIVKSHWDEFVSRKISSIMRRYKAMPELVESAFEVILGLSPYPNESFDMRSKFVGANRAAAVHPDLCLIRTENGWVIDVMGAEPAAYIVSRTYRKRMKELQSGKGDKAEMNHVGTYLQRAEQFIDSLAERRKTMRAIGEFLIQHQQSFVTTGLYQYLKPLSKSQMAKGLGLHESTVSRATIGKFVRLANAEVVPFDVFFKPALRVQKMIEEILATENPKSPMSDEEIAKRLAAKGVHIARRTVNKYRDRTKLLSSRGRRSA